MSEDLYMRGRRLALTKLAENSRIQPVGQTALPNAVKAFKPKFMKSVDNVKNLSTKSTNYHLSNRVRGGGTNTLNTSSKGVGIGGGSFAKAAEERAMIDQNYIAGIVRGLHDHGVVKVANITGVALKVAQDMGADPSAAVAEQADPAELQQLSESGLSEGDIQSAAKVVQVIAEMKQKSDMMAQGQAQAQAAQPQPPMPPPPQAPQGGAMGGQGGGAGGPQQGGGALGGGGGMPSGMNT